MATASFDERVVVRDSKMIKKMREDLESLEPVRHNIYNNLTIKTAEENGKIWAMKLYHSKRS